MFDLGAKLKKTREGFISPLRKVFQRRSTLGEEERETIEELLLGSDIGVEACERIMDELREQRDYSDSRAFLRDEFLSLLDEGAAAAAVSGGDGPRAIVVVGVNGVGKTTSIAKLAHFHMQQGKRVVLAAADTFRAAAGDQLAEWAQRLKADIVLHREGGDPAAVAFDACTAANSRAADLVIIDTAGRLHTRVNLMEELKKIKRVCGNVLGPEAVETLLVLDATLGQNSLHQAREFTRSIEAQGIILTKLDSTAKGGIVIAIKRSLGIPVRYIGVGEQLGDFAAFDAAAFVDALLD